MKCAILLFTGCIIAQLSFAQNPGFRELEPKSSPTTDYYKQQITDQVLKQLNKIDWEHVDRTTSGGTTLYTIPVVVHVLHNYGSELVADTSIYKMIDLVNSYFLKTNPDTVNIIDKFKPVAANTQIAFKLATKDPNGDQTKGVEHIFTYLTYMNYNYIDQSKINQWPQDRYLNIWIVNNIPSSSLGSSIIGDYYTPPDAAYIPYYDGIVFSYYIGQYIADGYGSYLSHYFARYLNLPYPCNDYSGACVDADGIADTPPCNASYTCSNIYDTVCDTPNAQNIMSEFDDSCGIMFTYGQGQYMQYILQIDIGNRDSLVTPYNFSTTGMNQPMPDMMPVADFSTYSPYPVTTLPPKRFFCQGQQITFKNESWNDTIITASWTFSNNANIPTSTSLTTVLNKFHQPGWVTVSLAATGNNTGTTTLTNPEAVFITDSIPTIATGYVQEFTPGSMGKWPMFNYYNNRFKWQIANAGYLDNYSVEYTGYDNRTFPQNMTGTPQGDVDDVYTPAFDLTGFTDSCYLNFMLSGASYTSETRYMNDSLEIDYSPNQAQTWIKLRILKGSLLHNKGTITTPYIPASISDWIPNAISLPSAARTAYTIFRLRYYPGADSMGMSSSNNVFLDHFNFSGYPENVAIIDQMADGVSLLPNPTHGNSYVIIKGKTAILTAKIVVIDIAGKVVYETTSNNNSNTTRVELPENIFTSKGLYFIHVTTDRINQTEKLVVY